jgi:hypothetical protein
MFCPSCGAESEDRQQFCRKCGVNLGLIGKALTLSESIARGDRGPLPKVKEIMQNIKVDQVTDEISRGLDQMNNAIVHSMGTGRLKDLQSRAKAEEIRAKATGEHPHGPWCNKQLSPQERRHHHIAEGTKSLFAGVAMMIALYYFAGAIVLKIPPEFAAQIPVDLALLIRNVWMLGLIPMLKGFGELVGVVAAGRLTDTTPAQLPASVDPGPPAVTGAMDVAPPYEPGTVTEGTTALFDEIPSRETADQSPRR